MARNDVETGIGWTLEGWLKTVPPAEGLEWVNHIVVGFGLELQDPPTKILEFARRHGPTFEAYTGAALVLRGLATAVPVEPPKIEESSLAWPRRLLKQILPD